MKKEKLNLATMQGKLSRAEMKEIQGGVNDDGGGGYKCCWKDNPTNCSDCVPGAYPKYVSGATAVAC
ncbi:MAG: hypothetical protein KDC56_05655 [Flavobacteriaceae bacterium]|nr:hypothetical protein [Flavobacteriaceae bacterium]